MKTAFLCFFPVYPTNMGSAEVIRSLFLSWPGQRKLFQISHLKSKDNKNLKSIKIFIEKPILKIINIPLLIISALNYLKGERKKIIVIEGPSWIGYSFLSIILIKLFSSKTKIIYHSHSIEYEVRKMTSSNFIVFLTKILERYVFNNVDLATSVSQVEKNKIKKIYNCKTVNLNNGISKKILKFKKNKILKFEYLIYCGSYKYLPNKLAIDYLIEKIMPKLLINNPKLKLVITGGGYENKKKFLLNLGIVSKQRLLNIIYNSKLMVIPLDKGTGTRIKIIEALSIGAKIITTSKGIEGINLLNKNKLYPIITRKENFHKIINNIFNNKNKYKHNNNFIKKEYLMENIVKNFLKNSNVKNIIKKN